MIVNYYFMTVHIVNCKNIFSLVFFYMNDLPVFVDTISVAQILALYIHKACPYILYFLEGSNKKPGPML